MRIYQAPYEAEPEMGIHFLSGGSISTVLFLLPSSASYGCRVFSGALRKGEDMYFNQLDFGRRLKECREQIGMTQEELAILVGVEKQHISRMERGTRACSIDLLVILATTLHVSTDYLLIGRSINYENISMQLQSTAFQLSMIAKNL